MHKETSSILNPLFLGKKKAVTLYLSHSIDTISFGHCKMSDRVEVQLLSGNNFHFDNTRFINPIVRISCGETCHLSSCLKNTNDPDWSLLDPPMVFHQASSDHLFVEVFHKQTESGHLALIGKCSVSLNNALSSPGLEAKVW
jgi:hypothetical protein